MRIPESLEQLASWVAAPGRQVFFFKADWCGDCQFIYPFMAEIEATFPELSFIQIDRDAYPQVGLEWDIYGIPSFVVVDNGREIGRLVNKKRKHKEEIVSFLAGLE